MSDRTGKETVLEFLDRIVTDKMLPSTITVERTMNSKYLFYSLVRHYRRLTSIQPRFFVYSRAEANAVKGLIEEHSLFNKSQLIILEGFSKAFTDSLAPPEGVYIVSETNDGQLMPESFSPRHKRLILKALQKSLAVRVSARDLINLDWSSLSSFEDFEVFLRRAKIFDWSAEDIEKNLQALQSGNILMMLKRASWEDLLALGNRYSLPWVYRQVQELLSQLISYKALRAMNVDEQKIQRDLDLSWYRAKELEEAHQVLTMEEVRVLSQRVVSLDFLSTFKPDVGIPIFLLNNPIALRRASPVRR